MITEFNCEKDILMENLSTVSKAVSPKGTTPQIECFYIEAKEETLTIIGTNNEISIKSQFEANIETEGTILINAKNFFDMIRLIPNGNVNVSVSDEYIVTIKSGETVYEIIGLENEGFPFVENSEITCKFAIPENDLREAIKKTNFSIGTDEKKVVFMGALFEIKDSSLKVVTLDGYRLALVSKKIETSTVYDSFIIPGKSLNELFKILTESEENIYVNFSEKGCLIKIGNFEFFTRLIEGEFFNYEQILPKNFNIEAIVDRRKLGEALERCSLVITPDSREPVRMKITDNKIDLLTVSRIGKVEDSMEVNKTGENIEIGFNNKFLLDIMKSLEDNYLIFNFTNNLSPCIIKSSENEDYIFLVLPVRLK